MSLAQPTPDGNGGAEVARVADRYAAADAARMEELNRLCRLPELRVVARGRSRAGGRKARLRVVKTCRGPECSREAKRGGLCIAHHRQLERGGKLDRLRAYGMGGAPCPGPDCTRTIVLGGLCRSHYQQVRDGKLLTPLKAWRRGS